MSSRYLNLLMFVTMIMFSCSIKINIKKEESNSADALLELKENKVCREQAGCYWNDNQKRCVRKTKATKHKVCRDLVNYKMVGKTAAPKKRIQKAKPACVKKIPGKVQVCREQAGCYWNDNQKRCVRKTKATKHKVCRDLVNYKQICA